MSFTSYLYDKNGNRLAGGLIYIQEPDSSSPMAVYMDEDMKTPHFNPIVLDAYGSLPDIYFPDGEYRITVCDSSGSTVFGHKRQKVKDAIFRVINNSIQPDLNQSNSTPLELDNENN
jgi:hypothetical protein